MNYYNFSIGDFNKNTRHLTLVERALYRELIDLYYEAEQPIPADDFNRLAKRVCAKTDDEKAALKEVLTEFFYIENDAYHHSRCDAEILIYKEKIEKASLAGKASALSRAKRAVNKRSTGVKRTLNETSTPNPNPTTQSYLKTLSDKSDDAAKVLDHLNEKTGGSYRAVDANLRLIASRISEGATVEEIKSVIDDRVMAWGSDPKMVEYLRPKTLFSATNFNNYIGAIGKSAGVKVDA